MGIYYDNNLTIIGTPSAVESAAALLNALMDEFEDAGGGGEAVNRVIGERTKPVENGEVALSCYTSGHRLDLTEWKPDFGSGGTGKIMLDAMTDQGCDRFVFQESKWTLIDVFGSCVFEGDYDLWFRSKSDPNGNDVCAAILSKLSISWVGEVITTGPDEAEHEYFAYGAMLLLSLGRLATNGRICLDDRAIRKHRKVLSAIPAYIETVLGIGYNINGKQDKTLLRAAKAWAEEQVLKNALGKTDKSKGTLSRPSAMRI